MDYRKAKKIPRRLIRNAFAEAWEREAQRVADGRGTRQWTEREQLELLSTGRVSGYSVHHMKNKYHHPQWADKVENFQFLQNYFYASNPDNEHDMAHRANLDGSTNGYFDHETGITHDFEERLPDIKRFIKPLKEFYLKGHAWETQTDINTLRSRYSTLRKDITEQDKELIKRKGINYVLGLKPQSAIVMGKVRGLHTRNTKRSWREEIKMIALKGQCSCPWTAEQLERLFRNKRIDGFEPRAIEGNFSTLEDIAIDNIVFVEYKSPVTAYKKETFALPDNYFENIAANKGLGVDTVIYELTGFRIPRPAPKRPRTTSPAIPFVPKPKMINHKARKKAREVELALIKKGQGTCPWTLEEQERWFCIGQSKGKIKGFEARLIYPDFGEKVENITFLSDSMTPVSAPPLPEDGKLPRRQVYHLQERFVDTDTYKKHFVNDRTIEQYLQERDRQAKKLADEIRRKEMEQRPSVKSYTKSADKKKKYAGKDTKTVKKGRN